jgi:thiamine biosynthesis lipoprotein
MRIRAPLIVAVAGLALLAGWAYYRTRPAVTSLLVYQQEPTGIMGTTSNLVLVSDREKADQAEQTLAAAEAQLRHLEALLSTWIEASPVSRFNRSGSGEPIAIPGELQEVLTLAREIHRSSQGAFDITVGPLIELWRISAEQGSAPDEGSLIAARQQSTWDQIRFSDGFATKSATTTRIDIDGIAKGYAIDRASELMQRSGIAGGMVEVGGDLRVFGTGPEDRPWIVAIRSPFEDRVWAELQLGDGAVCSSGDYARPLEIGEKRYSHIVDPRSGRPTQGVHAVTVVGPDAATADAWATALSVLGKAGLRLLDADVQAMVVIGERDDYRVHATAGFRQLLVRAAFDLEE